MDSICKIIENRILTGPYRRIIFHAPEIAASAKPGQFVHVQISGLRDRILRRPFSISMADPEQGTLTLVYKIVGQGTEQLARLSAGNTCKILGPLGNSYSIPRPDVFPVIVTGGYGAASTLFLASKTQRPGAVLMGARTAADLILCDEYRAAGYAVRVATNDGSAGVKGFVTELLPDYFEKYGQQCRIYACGPSPMLLALGDLADARNITAELSMDQHMCCGVGACFACVIRVKDPSSPDGWRYSRTCKEGPVYLSSEVYHG